ncbi:hypothetical protein WJX84_011338 [Apatococcus fuscideae]|uniref:Prolyl 4-hydroxylase alpha subunit Fe(2+) 2OG dioxygenase domain-containing protein n=1 Tax=Apatococcus fuscideae TaxID=2026836 RepID=A0AAW1S1U6_9CHLO
MPSNNLFDFNSDAVKAVSNAAKGLDAPFHVSGSVNLENPIDLAWQGGKETSSQQGCQALKQDKLNLYRRGDFFKTHVDIPAEPSTNGAMFGTLVLCLPSWHMGGELAISHGPLKASTDWAEASADNAVQ